MSLKQVLCIFARVKLQRYTKCKDAIYTEKKESFEPTYKTRQE